MKIILKRGPESLGLDNTWEADIVGWPGPICGALGGHRCDAIEQLILANPAVFGVSEIVDSFTDPDHPEATRAVNHFAAHVVTRGVACAIASLGGESA